MISNATVCGENLFKLQTKDTVYAVLTTVSSSLSIFGGLGIICIYIIFKKLRGNGRKLLVFLSLMDALTALGNILGVVWLMCRTGCVCHVIYESKDFCRFHAAITIFSSISSFLWMLVIGLCLLKSIVFNNPSFATRFMKVFYIICWSIPAVIVILALGFGVIGYDKNIASWCWIDPDIPSMLVWQFITGKMWELSAYVLSIILYTAVRVFLFKHGKKSFKETTRNTRKAVLQDANRKLTFIPLVFIVLRMWGTLRFLLGSTLHYDAEWISYLQGVGDSSQGFANFVLYCALTDTVRKHVFAAICKRTNETEMSHSISVSTAALSHVRVGPTQQTLNP